MYRKTWAEINLRTLYNNYSLIKEKANEKTVIPVIKANAYGHGSLEVAKYLHNKGVEIFAVNLLDEAVELKNENPNYDVLVMGAISEEDFPTLSKFGIIFTIHDEDMLVSVSQTHLNLRFHIKIDTGMNRLGIKSLKHINHFLSKIKDKKTLDFEGVYSHCSTADSNQDYFERQLTLFKEFVGGLNVKPRCVHISNSSATMKYEQNIDFTTHVRAGIALYGYTLEENDYGLEPVMRVLTKPVQTKYVKSGEFVGYDNSYEAEEDEVLSILPIGYADGINRKYQGGYVSVRNQLYPIIGRISMDQLHIKCNGNVKKDDIVTVMGNHLVNAKTIAQHLNTISYEVLTSISSRVPRTYLE